MRGKVFFFTGASFCAIFFLEPSGNLLLEPSGSSWVPPDGSIFVFAIGSPPRMRGKVAAAVPALFLRGITPACAGKSEKQVPFLPPYQDHPRVCGEKARTLIVQDEPQGSPPRMRGKEVKALLHFNWVGITPACAGKSIYQLLPCRGARGSPPRVRGKGISRHRVALHRGITPAYAGKSQSYRQPCSAMWDHPRVCGEKSKPKPGKDRRMESPPRVRGKGVRLPPLHVPAGITPAYAGKRLQNDKGNIYGRDHPRVCGEKRTTAGRSSGACAATSNAIGMVTSALYRSAMSYTKEHSCPTCTNPSPGAHPSATMTAWASPYRQACTVGHTGAGAEQQHRNARRRDLNDTLFIRYGDGTVLTAQRAVFQVQKGHPVPDLRQRLQIRADHARHIIHGCFLRAGWSSGQGRRLCRGQCPDTASPGTLPGRSPAGCPHRSPPAM